MLGKLKNASKRIKAIFIGISTSVMTALITAAPVLAAGDQISTQINSGLKKVYTIITAIVLPIAAIAAAICAIKMIWGDQRSAETAKATLIRIVIGVALVYLAPFLVEQVSSWFSGSSSNIW